MNIFKKISLTAFLALNQPEIIAQPDSKKEINSEYKNDLVLLSNYLNKKGFQIDSLLEDSKFEIYPQIDTLFTKAAEMRIKNLDEYKKILKYEEKKCKISEFINGNLEKLLEAEKTYGIKKELIASVIGIESNFGEIIGRHIPFNVYVSLYVKDYKKEFAKIHLEELLIFCKKNSLNVFDLKSSYAGAISYAQFLPSSLNSWFIGDELYNMDNNILSVANYLSYFKKQTGSISKAVYKYNPSKLYVQAVIALSEDAEKELGKSNENKK